MAPEYTQPDLKSSDPAATTGDNSGVTSDAVRAAAELGRGAARKAGQARYRTAAGLESAAKSVHAGADRMASAGHGAGDALSNSARYVREHDMGNMMDDVMGVIRSNPGVALLGAAALGFLIGRAITRD